MYGVYENHRLTLYKYSYFKSSGGVLAVSEQTCKKCLSNGTKEVDPFHKPSDMFIYVVISNGHIFYSSCRHS